MPGIGGGRGLRMRRLLSILIWGGSILLTVLVFFAVLVVRVLLPFDRKARFAHMQGFWWSDGILALNPYWELDVAGLEHIDRGRTYVIVANHQSLADIVVMYKTRLHFKWVAKESLFRLPFLGWTLALSRHIRLRRGDFGSIKRVYREAADWLRRDVSVLFFPEGTRSVTEELNAFQSGAFKLAIKEKKTILPISIQGTGAAIPRGGWVFKTRAHARLTVLPPIETATLAISEFAQLRDRVYAQLSTPRGVAPSLHTVQGDFSRRDAEEQGRREE